MRIAVAGATGLVGSELVSRLIANGHSVVLIVRRRTQNRMGACAEVLWNPSEGVIECGELNNCDAVVHLGGDNIAHGRWSPGKKALIRDSRVISTQLLSSTLAGLPSPPKVFCCASAIGFYGDRGDEVLTENSISGPSFLSRTCVEWEQATRPAVDGGIRVVNLRIGVVLSPKGGALQKMLTPFRLCAGGVVGSGRQWWSWIALEDLVRAIEFCIETESLTGPVNAVAPGVVNNREFTKALGAVLRRPTICPLPAFVVKLLLGEMGEELLLGSTRVEPTQLARAGFEFRYPTVMAALKSML